MKKILIFLLIFAVISPFVFSEENISKEELRKLLGETYMMDKDYDRAADQYIEILKKDSSNLKARVALADILSWQKKYDQSIGQYKKALDVEPDNIEIKIKLADVLSWKKSYNQAINLYDELINEKGDLKLRLQKARILGWAGKYTKSLKEYQKILNLKHDESVELELKAKKAYWDNRVKAAIGYCKELIKRNPDNVEAMFDLSQIYSYQSMWDDAAKTYKKILNKYPNHFRAREGLGKVDLISYQPSLNTGYEFFEADSKNRIDDIKKHAFFNKLSFPISYNFRVDFEYKLTGRSFSDFSDVVENESKIKLIYARKPDWWIDGFYDAIIYNKGIDTMHTFGESINFRVFDMGVLSLSHQRERLENSSKVIRDNYYRDNFKQRLYMDFSKRFKLGIDYLFSNYSDGNSKHEPGFDILYYLSLEPKRFFLKYRYFFRDFNDKANEYFSPKDFSTHTATFSWRHFLNKEEVFFGADDIYYDLTYDISVDSEDIVTHKFSAGFNWDISKSLNFNIKGSIVDSSVNIYKEKSTTVSVKYYF